MSCFFSHHNVWFILEKIPWIGQPNSILQSKEIEEVIIKCYSYDLTQSLVLKKHYEDHGNTAIVYEPFETMSVNDDLIMATFRIERTSNLAGSYHCFTNDTQKSSLYSIEIINTNESLWSAWSEWSHCQDQSTDVGISLVKRSRTRNPNEIEEETRFCRCSDLAEFPRPR